MATKIFVHGSGHKATSWEKTISYMTNNEDIVCPNLSSILEGKEASYENLYSSFVSAARLSQISLKKSRPAVLRKVSGTKAKNLVCA